MKETTPDVLDRIAKESVSDESCVDRCSATAGEDVTDPERPLRIGIVTDGLVERVTDGAAGIANGGVGVYIYNLVKHLQRIAPANEYVLIRRGKGSLDIYRNGCGRNVFLRGSPLTVWDLAYWRAIAPLHLDILHYPNQFGGAFLPRSIKRVMTLHDITPLLFPHYHPTRRVLAYRFLLRRSLHRADHVIVDAASTRDDLIAHRLAGDNAITVIPLGVPDVLRSGIANADFRRRYAVPERFILNVGVFEPRKNHALLVEALGRVHAAGERVSLVLVGRDGWRWRNPLDDPAAAPLRPWVHVFRNVPDADLAEFYHRATVFAYPSLYEGFGLPVVEAMACGTPVVASRTSSLPEVTGQAALLADPTDAADFAARLLEVLRDPALRDRLVAAGRRQVRNLSWQRTAERTLAVYRRVCAA